MRAIVFALEKVAVVFKDGLGIPSAALQFAHERSLYQSANLAATGQHSQSVDGLAVHEPFAFRLRDANGEPCAIG